MAALLVWVFVAETVLDLANSTIAGIREELFSTASGVTWLILTFYVPLLWVSLGPHRLAALFPTPRAALVCPRVK
jgi:hypothetical protein